MAPGGPRPTLLLLLALLPPGLAWLSASRSAQDFVARHVDFPRTSPPPGQQYCDYLMWQRISLIGSCRRSFTFVHVDPSQLARLCRCGGRGRCQPPASSSVSRHPVPITTCHRVAGAGLGGFGGYGGVCSGSGCEIKGRCSYRGRLQRRLIRMACRGGEPVGVLGTV